MSCETFETLTRARTTKGGVVEIKRLAEYPAVAGREENLEGIRKSHLCVEAYDLQTRAAALFEVRTM